jgi:hypothetical protein
MDRDEMSNLYRGPSIDASYQVSVHLAQRRRLKCEKLTDDGFINKHGYHRQFLVSDLLISKKIFSSVKRKITLAIISLRN